MTKVLTSRDIAEAAHLLKEEELVAFPTETVYGLGASAFSERAIGKIFLAKGRPSDNPLIVHFSQREQVEELAVDIPEVFYLLSRAFHPGPLTLVVKRGARVPSVVSAGMPSIALRMPKHPVAQELIALAGPLAAPSANLSGKPSATTSAHVLEDFQGKIAAVIEGGPSLWGLESTVVSLLTEEPVLLRPGVITQEEIEAVLGRRIASHRQGDPILSPGMKYRHYAPEAPVRLFTEVKEIVATTPKSLLLSRLKIEGPWEWAPLSGRELYSLLRRADREGFQEILVLCDSGIQAEHALMNRLQYASNKR